MHNVIVADLTADNGVVHVINSVLFPATISISKFNNNG